MLENASENENLNLEKQSAEDAREHKNLPYIFCIGLISQKRKYIDLRAPEPSSPRAFENIEPTLAVLYA
jgi:hypothetical protein